ncbi:MAG: GGDEF domain-containing protein [Dehalococcoidia bacterium]
MSRTGAPAHGSARSGDLPILDRAQFLRDVAAGVSDASRGGPLVALMLLDINGFKRVNDRYGVANGNDVLRALAELLRAAIGPDDLVTRLGGDEFAIAARGLNRPAARRAVMKLKMRVAARPLVRLNRGDGIHISVAVGFAVTGSAGASLGDLMAAAERDLIDDKWRARPAVARGFGA